MQRVYEATTKPARAVYRKIIGPAHRAPAAAPAPPGAAGRSEGVAA